MFLLRRLSCFWGRLQRSSLLAIFGSKRSIDTRHSKALLQSEDQRLQRDINLGTTSLAFFDISRCSSKGLAVGSQSFVDAIDVRLSAFPAIRSEEHTSELQSLMRISYAVFCLKKKNKTQLLYKYQTINCINIA